MAPKRSHRARDACATANKRRKVVGSETQDILDIDQLDWKTVTLPDRLDDAEGFYSLEEIEGVDIVRPSGNGEISFKAPTEKIKGILKNSTADSDDSNWEVWDGFSDGAPHEATFEQVESKKPDVKKANKGRLAGKKPENGKSKRGEIPDSIENRVEPELSFAALEDESEEDMDVSAWDALRLRAELQTSLAKLKFSTPTPIQTACIPAIIQGHDVIGKASTGSGKTLAFGIPILEHYLKTYTNEKVGSSSSRIREKIPLALILSPTRELAHQLNKHFIDLISYAPHTHARIATVTGGLSVYKQQRLLADADIIIATPGRLWEVVGSLPGFLTKLKKIKFLVIDEADRLLSAGHFKEMEEILNAIDRVEETEEGYADNSENESPQQTGHQQRQTLVFSATFHKTLQQKLSGKAQYGNDDLLNKTQSMDYLLRKLNFREERPKFIDVNPISQMAENLKEGLVQCAPMDKDLFLYALLLYHPKHRTLIFTNSISAVRRITRFLQNLDLPTFALHSAMTQKARLRSVERFSSPSEASSCLVATDVAARGLDIKGIDLIIHYHVPRTADAYVHRSGRTARASASGKSILICAPEETTGVARLAAKIHSKVSQGAKVTGKKSLLQVIDLDRRIVDRLRPRVTLSKQIAESILAKEKLSSEDDWLRSAADDLGVDYDSAEFAEQGAKGKGRGRGGGRQAREQKAASLSKAEMAGLRAQLKDLLAKKVNVGISEKYLTAGRVDVDALLRGEGNHAFLGHMDTLSF
ncbi:ATP-dependent RNA helicase [Ophidiomyces ophidiicola]|uniref:ATP-dependent RNA helicase n=1 Tax=Ophidiomyces ophidiicola TaxID=1387563 RepID=UPI0020C51EB7|nr:ATP-dependent RNA helicase [Ophidiomyces ophidiicola]KAI1939671.1 ATP-dependent RNA helicase [Ophidiomyces ophidiicola]KAI2047357.1 ATP-dependent RNA helicase [Ophidiomyces ophidiicola]KAI2083809.1 ATP-dependent RNA helicase [Ophidiomyces ophidiicola]